MTAAFHAPPAAQNWPIEVRFARTRWSVVRLTTCVKPLGAGEFHHAARSKDDSDDPEVVPLTIGEWEPISDEYAAEIISRWPADMLA